MPLIMPNGAPNLEAFQNWSKTTFGREANPMELQQIGSKIGAPGADGQYTQDQYAQAQKEATGMAQAQGWNPQPQQPQPQQPQTQNATGPQKVNGVPLTYQAGSYASQYNPAQFAQYVPQQQNTQQRDALLNSVLSNPQTMGQQWQDQMFEQGKESANSYAKQLGQQNSQRLAGRGLSANGGAQRENEQQTQQDLMETLLGGRRAIATQAVTQNRADELNALNAANTTYGADLDRALKQYQAQLAGQTAQAQENQFGADYGLRQFGVNEAARQAQSQSALDTGRFNFEVTDTDRQRQLQEFLGVVGAILEQQRFKENQRQFNQGYGLDAAKLGMTQDQFNRTFGENRRQFDLGFGENQRQFNNQLGLNWANSQNGQVNGILGIIQQLFGG